MLSIKLFLHDEAGAVTIEWVALSAGVVLLALGVIAVLSDPVTGVATGISTNLGTVTSQTLSGATTG